MVYAGIFPVDGDDYPLLPNRRRLWAPLRPVNLAEKHVHVLCAHFLEMKYTPATIQYHLSILRQFAGWIGKSGLVKSAEHYF